jgi:hypothetical protein
VVHNVYSYNAGNRGFGNRGSLNPQNNNYNNGHNNNYNNNSRASYRGGTGGVQARPQPPEAAAAREATAPRMNTQAQHAQNYSVVRGQFAAQNHGQPATPAIRQPLPADRGSRPAMQNQSRGGQQGGQSRGGGQQGQHR